MKTNSKSLNYRKLAAQPLPSNFSLFCTIFQIFSSTQTLSWKLQIKQNKKLAK